MRFPLLLALHIALSSSQLQDAAKGKLSRCEHIDIDFGVSHVDQEDDIYHTPAELKSSMKRSGTADNLNSSGGGASAVQLSPRPAVRMSSPALHGRRRPFSQLVDSSRSSPIDTERSPTRSPNLNVCPPQFAPPPPPPPRTVSKTAEALQLKWVIPYQSVQLYPLSLFSPTGLPVAPKRTKRKSMFPDQLEPPTEDPREVCLTPHTLCINFTFISAV